MFNGYVRPHLEYYILQIWSPYLKKDIKCIEKVQRKATKLVKGLRWKSHEQRLEVLQITTLEKKIRGDLMQVYRILKGFGNVDKDHFFETDSGGGHSLRGHLIKMKVLRSRPRLQLQQGFFSQRLVNAWNRIPASIVDAPSVNTFKILRLDDLNNF